MTTPSVTIAYDISPPSGLSSEDASRFPTSGQQSFPLSTADSLPASDSAQPSDAVEPLNADLDPHYRSLVSTLRIAQAELNSRLTDWKDLIGPQLEKHKEVPPAAAQGKQGMGKAMIMVMAAREADGRQPEQRRHLNGTGAATAVQPDGSKPTDDQESDSEEDEIPADEGA